MKKKIVIPLVLCVVAIILVVYFLSGGNAQAQKPEIKSMTHRWGNVVLETTEIITEAMVHNPNNFPIYFTGINYTIYMNDIKMGTGTSETDVLVRANSDKNITFKTLIDNTKIDEWWVSHINNDEKTTFKLEGYIYFDLSITTFEYHFERTQEVQTNMLG